MGDGVCSGDCGGGFGDEVFGGDGVCTVYVTHYIQCTYTCTLYKMDICGYASRI